MAAMEVVWEINSVSVAILWSLPSSKLHVSTYDLSLCDTLVQYKGVTQRRQTRTCARRAPLPRPLPAAHTSPMPPARDAPPVWTSRCLNDSERVSTAEFPHFLHFTIAFEGVYRPETTVAHPSLTRWAPGVATHPRHS
jgi:hypothetical protein